MKQLEERITQRVKRNLTRDEDIIEYPKDRKFDLASKSNHFKFKYNRYAWRLNALQEKMDEFVAKEYSKGIMKTENPPKPFLYLLEAYRRCRGYTLWSYLQERAINPKRKSIELQWNQQWDVLNHLITTADDCKYTHVNYLKQTKNQIYAGTLHYHLVSNHELACDIYRQVEELDDLDIPNLYEEFFIAEHKLYCEGVYHTRDMKFLKEMFHEVYPNLTEEDYKHYEIRVMTKMFAQSGKLDRTLKTKGD